MLLTMYLDQTKSKPVRKYLYSESNY